MLKSAEPIMDDKPRNTWRMLKSVEQEMGVKLRKTMENVNPKR